MQPLIQSAARLALPLALLVNPWLLAGLCLPGRNSILRAAATGACGVALNTGVAVALHLLKVPVDAPVLASVHLALALLLSAAYLLRRPGIRGAEEAVRPPPPKAGARVGSLLLLFLAFLLLVLPFTPLAGIDTYKWQDLATNIRLERNVPWLVHPLSLFGFTARSYPSAQPILLATVQIMGAVGVDGGFFLLSAWFGAMALCSAAVLGRILFERPASVLWFTAFYVFSPVFMRYNHWATGRGLFLALYPLFLASLAARPRVAVACAAAGAASLLALSHKVGLVCAPLLALSVPLAALLPRGRARWPLWLGAAAAAAGAWLIAPDYVLPGAAGRLLGCARLAAVRLGLIAPLAAVGLLFSPDLLAVSGRRRLFPALVLALPLLCEEQMYGALTALPFACLAAVGGWEVLRNRLPAKAALLAAAVAAALAAGALGVVIHRSLDATPRAVRDAALFLEQHDPEGPYRLVAPERVRTGIQAYVSGCPRIDVAARAGARARLAGLPSVRGEPRDAMARWISTLRRLLYVTETDVEWYGRDPRTYWITFEGRGDVPPGARLLYSEGGVAVYAGPADATPRAAAEQAGQAARSGADRGGQRR